MLIDGQQLGLGPLLAPVEQHDPEETKALETYAYQTRGHQLIKTELGAPAAGPRCMVAMTVQTHTA